MKLKLTREEWTTVCGLLIVAFILGAISLSIYKDEQNNTNEFVKIEKPAPLFQDVGIGFFAIGYDKNTYDLVESKDYYFITKTELIK